MTQSQATVLVVEDEALLLFDIADQLRCEGFIVFEATDAGAAIRQLEAHPEISVVFTDVNMPGSMDGLRLSSTIRDRWPPVKIIVTSGKRIPDDRLLPEGGMFLPKPYVASSVAAAIQKLLT